MMRGRLPIQPSRRHGALVLAAVLAVAGLWSGAGGRPASASGDGRPRLTIGVAARAVAPGVTYRRMRRRGPVVLHVVRIDPAEPSTIDVAPGGPRLGTSARTSSIARANGAIVAINGDFGLWRDTPLHPFEVDGALLTAGVQVGTNFAMHDDETESHIDTPQVSVTGRVANDSPFEVIEWNSGAPGRGRIAGYTAYGGDVARPPPHGCSARLVRDSALTWGPLGVGTTRRFRVDAVRCGGERRMRRDPRSVVLASRRWGVGADVMSGMVVGEPVRLTWSLGWQRVADTVGGMPRLVADGVVVVASACHQAFCRRHPRTGIGVAADGTVLLVVADGRSRRSVGMTLRRFGRTFAELGAVDAVNLDGGGSATMFVAGRGVVNRPSDPGGERGAVNAVLVLPGADPGSPLAHVAAAPRTAALADPASTGGLAAAWVAGSVVDAPAPPVIRRIAARFARYARSAR